jgi:hypothetical protein
MRITESTLRRLIRETLLTEAMVTPEAAAKMGLAFELNNDGRYIDVVATGHAGSGSISAKLIDNGHMRIWSVESSRVELSGLGPLLYDLVMDAAHPDPITSDRGAVSTSAKRVWDYYLNSRSDIEAIQLDNPDDFLTPQPDDNFSQQSAMNLDGFEGWPQSSLSKAYRRKDDRTPTLLALWNLDVLSMS